VSFADPRETDHWTRIAPGVWSKYGKVIAGMADKGKVELRREDDGGRSWRLAPYAPEGPGADPGAPPPEPRRRPC
jgi:hypothetical protein